MQAWIKRQKWLKQLTTDIAKNRFNPSLIRHFDWPMFLLVLFLSLCGVVAIFAATASATETEVTGLANILRTHSITYPRLQLIWMAAGIIAMCAVIFFDYRLYGKYADVIYWLNIVVLLSVLTVEAGRGGMSAFFNWGSESSSLGERGFQPSEFGKVAIIIALAHLFSKRKKPIKTVRELIPACLYVGIPMVLVVLQPDFGTMLVYIAIFAVLLWVSGTDLKIIAGVILIGICLLVPLWYYMNASSTSFRLTRILMWLHPEDYPDEARQVINGQIAIGSGGFTGKGVVSLGSFASLGFIPDDHTDFCFAIVCEAFGFIGASVIILGFAMLLGRLIWHAVKTEDKFGSYIITGVMAMFLFHIVENICMILGILPVTGIPLPFISYGGSNYLTNMMCIGLVMNVVMRSRYQRTLGDNRYVNTL
ncbi:MAG: rod shape-determining protein RodA [Clostridia bacterium]|nr:rod shape-determining protein RodA [Clostridia bacterium]